MINTDHYLYKGKKKPGLPGLPGLSNVAHKSRVTMGKSRATTIFSRATSFQRATKFPEIFSF